MDIDNLKKTLTDASTYVTRAVQVGTCIHLFVQVAFSQTLLATVLCYHCVKTTCLFPSNFLCNAMMEQAPGSRNIWWNISSYNPYNYEVVYVFKKRACQHKSPMKVMPNVCFLFIKWLKTWLQGLRTC
jgi:hypothetical protein